MGFLAVGEMIKRRKMIGRSKNDVVIVAWKMVLCEEDEGKQRKKESEKKGRRRIKGLLQMDRF